MKGCGLLFLFVSVILNADSSIASEETVVCEESAYPPDNKDLIPLYVVNLDLSPLQRWAPLVIDKRHMLHELVDDVKDLLESLAGEKIFRILMKSLDSMGQEKQDLESCRTPSSFNCPLAIQERREGHL
ncbi:acid ceramidase-like isoform X2 [Macrobrachium nipponense]|uniref:acid ceramidase-like isoform X2 n=1 Tax=Macrobrachium nipponense TaxID=159736 RepID=UPI0030C83643